MRSHFEYFGFDMSAYSSDAELERRLIIVSKRFNAALKNTSVTAEQLTKALQMMAKVAREAEKENETSRR